MGHGLVSSFAQIFSVLIHIKRKNILQIVLAVPLVFQALCPGSNSLLWCLTPINSRLSNSLGKGPATKSDEFLEKFQKGEGGIFSQKFMLQILGTGPFEHEIDTKRVNAGFRVCFFNNCFEKNQNKIHIGEGMCMHFILSGPHTSLHICNHIHYKKIAT